MMIGVPATPLPFVTVTVSGAIAMGALPLVEQV